MLMQDYIVRPGKSKALSQEELHSKKPHQQKDISISYLGRKETATTLLSNHLYFQ